MLYNYLTVERFTKEYVALQLTGRPPPNQSNTLHTNVGFQICRADNLVITLHTFSERFISWLRRILNLRLLYIQNTSSIMVRYWIGFDWIYWRVLVLPLL